MVAIVGANSAGKSTILRSVSGILRPKRGFIEFLGDRLDKLHPHMIAGNGLCQVPEGRRLFPYMTVIDNLRAGAYAGEARQKYHESIEEVLSLFPILKERTRQTAGTLSGGEQQMLAIARALMSRPKLLMLDEPSLGLAPIVIERIFDSLQELKNRGVTILLVEQKTDKALEMADRAYVLEIGRITMEGKGKELLADDHIRKAYLGI